MILEIRVDLSIYLENLVLVKQTIFNWEIYESCIKLNLKISVIFILICKFLLWSDERGKMKNYNVRNYLSSLRANLGNSKIQIICSLLIICPCLFQMDGFDQTVNVKVIMATNRADTLDPALLRPGRLDRKIEFPVPDRRQKRLVFQVSFVF